jgi:shikimate kinase
LKYTDLIIGCLSQSENIIQSRWLAPDTVILDAIYAHPTHLVEQALIAGCRVIDGKHWLLHQAARAFVLFTGIKPATGMMEKGFEEGAGTAAILPVIGFMGSGKSSVTRILAKRLGYKRFDLDRAIERQEGKSIAAIFADRGEPFFRKLESAALADACQYSGVVLDCGGGIVKNVANRRRLKLYGPVIWLWADEEETRRRLGGDKTRPVLNGSLDSESFRRLLKSRIPLYAQTADILFPASHKSPNQIADDIISEIDCAGIR